MKLNKRKALAVPALAVAASLSLGVAGASAATSGTVAGTAALSPGTLDITPPAALSFAGTLNGSDLTLNDTTAADDAYSVSDGTGSYAGWNVTVGSAAPFSYNDTTGATPVTYTLPTTALSLNGGAGAKATDTTGPTIACATGSTCTPATNTGVTYPVAIPSSGTGAVVLNAPVNTGMGVNDISALNWWLAVPSNAHAGSYTATFNYSANSGPAA